MWRRGAARCSTCAAVAADSRAAAAAVAVVPSGARPTRAACAIVPLCHKPGEVGSAEREDSCPSAMASAALARPALCAAGASLRLPLRQRAPCAPASRVVVRPRVFPGVTQPRRGVTCCAVEPTLVQPVADLAATALSDALGLEVRLCQHLCLARAGVSVRVCGTLACPHPAAVTADRDTTGASLHRLYLLGDTLLDHDDPSAQLGCHQEDYGKAAHAPRGSDWLLLSSVLSYTLNSSPDLLCRRTAGRWEWRA